YRIVQLYHLRTGLFVLTIAAILGHIGLVFVLESTMTVIQKLAVWAILGLMTIVEIQVVIALSPRQQKNPDYSDAVKDYKTDFVRLESRENEVEARMEMGEDLSTIEIEEDKEDIMVNLLIKYLRSSGDVRKDIKKLFLKYHHKDKFGLYLYFYELAGLILMDEYTSILHKLSIEASAQIKAFFPNDPQHQEFANNVLRSGVGEFEVSEEYLRRVLEELPYLIMSAEERKPYSDKKRRLLNITKHFLVILGSYIKRYEVSETPISKETVDLISRTIDLTYDKFRPADRFALQLVTDIVLTVLFDGRRYHVYLEETMWDIIDGIRAEEGLGYKELFEQKHIVRHLPFAFAVWAKFLPHPENALDSFQKRISAYEKVPENRKAKEVLNGIELALNTMETRIDWNKEARKFKNHYAYVAWFIVAVVMLSSSSLL
ncbi:MAG: hypothetical protein KC618_08690, partial [Candidatus Omnitrophica bacterium]|nr:hypothetical protein [Candidatus Omnitrophota bacterium]